MGGGGVDVCLICLWRFWVLLFPWWSVGACSRRVWCVGRMMLDGVSVVRNLLCWFHLLRVYASCKYSYLISVWLLATMYVIVSLCASLRISSRSMFIWFNMSCHARCTHVYERIKPCCPRAGLSQCCVWCRGPIQPYTIPEFVVQMCCKLCSWSLVNNWGSFFLREPHCSGCFASVCVKV